MGLAGDISELKGLVRGLSGTHPTKDEMQLELKERDGEIKALKKTIAGYNKVLWGVAMSFISLVVLMVWQYIINSGMKQ